MPPLTTPLLSQACRIFLTLAYPAGEEAIPPKKRLYGALPAEQPLVDFLPPNSCAAGVCQELHDGQGMLSGYEFRLGSAVFPHLKLRAERIDNHGHHGWVFMVDTHDFFMKGRPIPSGDHPDAARWAQLQNANRVLKEEIEHAFQPEGLMTPNSILRDDLSA